MYWLVGLLFVYSLTDCGHAKPSGAPCDVLASMLPAVSAHGDPSNSLPPYVVQFLNPGSETEPECYRPNRNYLIRIHSKDGSTFGGFILQCRDSNENRFGTFLRGSGNANNWQYQCHQSNSITHVRADPKEQLNVMWRTDGMAGEFTCKATVLQSMTVWWAKIPSRTLQPCRGGGETVFNGPR